MMKAGQSLALIKCKAKPGNDESRAKPGYDESRAKPGYDESRAKPGFDKSMAKPNNAEWLKKTNSPLFAALAKKMALHELTMLNQDCKSSKKGVTQKLKLHHEFTILDQDCIIHALTIRL